MTPDGDERVGMNRESVPLHLIRVPERPKNRWIVRDGRAKKATADGALGEHARGTGAISWNDKVNCREARGPRI